LDYERALRRIVDVGYSGVFTLELEGKTSYDDIVKYVKKLRKLVS
jgi:sugar phosphate isomerase/epimerase